MHILVYINTYVNVCIICLHKYTIYIINLCVRYKYERLRLSVVVNEISSENPLDLWHQLLKRRIHHPAHSHTHTQMHTSELIKHICICVNKYSADCVFLGVIYLHTNANKFPSIINTKGNNKQKFKTNALQRW